MRQCCKHTVASTAFLDLVQLMFSSSLVADMGTLNVPRVQRSPKSRTATTGSIVLCVFNVRMLFIYVCIMYVDTHVHTHTYTHDINIYGQ